MANATLASRLALCGELLRTPRDVTELSHLRIDNAGTAERYMLRGQKEVLEKRKLSNFDVSEDGARVTATAAGSSSLAYQLALDLRNVPPTCSCSCPVGHSLPDRLCKHGLALLLWRCEQLAAVDMTVSAGGNAGAATLMYESPAAPPPAARPSQPLPSQPATKRKLPGFLFSPPPKPTPVERPVKPKGPAKPGPTQPPPEAAEPAASVSNAGLNTSAPEAKPKALKPGPAEPTKAPRPRQKRAAPPVPRDEAAAGPEPAARKRQRKAPAAALPPAETDAGIVAGEPHLMTADQMREVTDEELLQQCREAVAPGRAKRAALAAAAAEQRRGTPPPAALLSPSESPAVLSRLEPVSSGPSPDAAALMEETQLVEAWEHSPRTRKFMEDKRRAQAAAGRAAPQHQLLEAWRAGEADVKPAGALYPQSPGAVCPQSAGRPPRSNEPGAAAVRLRGDQGAETVKAGPEMRGLPPAASASAASPRGRDASAAPACLPREVAVGAAEGGVPAPAKPTSHLKSLLAALIRPVPSMVPPAVPFKPPTVPVKPPTVPVKPPLAAARPAHLPAAAEASPQPTESPGDERGVRESAPVPTPPDAGAALRQPPSPSDVSSLLTGPRLGEVPLGEPPLGETPLGEPPMGGTALGDMPLGYMSLGEAASLAAVSSLAALPPSGPSQLSSPGWPPTGSAQKPRLSLKARFSGSQRLP